ncbi:MAG: hypothetical protein AB2A00_29635 [Myxococcota bacterium]
MSAKSNLPGVAPFLKLGEEKLTQLLTQLLSNEAFVTALQRAITSGLKAKGTVDKGLTRILSAFNVPTLEDVAIMRGKLEELEDAIAELAQAVQAVEEKASGHGGGGKKGKSRKAREAAEE